MNDCIKSFNKPFRNHIAINQVVKVNIYQVMFAKNNKWQSAVTTLIIDFQC